MEEKQKEVSFLSTKGLSWWEKNLPPDARAIVFEEAIRPSQEEKSLKIIAECKKASPSRGLLCKEYNPKNIAQNYKKCGANAISVLTDQTFFQGNIKHLTAARKSGLPILRKDFIISPLQLYEAKQSGADAILLIVRILHINLLKELYQLAKMIGLGVLVEVHTQKEIEIAIDLEAKVIGINHRNLKSLEMDMTLSSRLAPIIRRYLPNSIIIAESGIKNQNDIKRMIGHVDALLMGTIFMESLDISKRWRELFQKTYAT